VTSCLTQIYASQLRNVPANGQSIRVYMCVVEYRASITFVLIFILVWSQFKYMLCCYELVHTSSGLNAYFNEY
jgi:hypothetical protein